MKTRILLVDDHKIMRDGLSMILSHVEDMEVVGQAGSSAEAMEIVKSCQPEVVVMDIHLPDSNGIEIARKMLEKMPKLKVIALSSDPDIRIVTEALQAGLSGYILKDAASMELIHGIRTVLNGYIYVCPELNTALLQNYQKILMGAAPMQDKSDLSARETDVLRLMAEGLRSKEMADRLDISVKTVETYRTRLMQKLGYSSSAELVRFAIREGIAKA